jgi:hypothetical protein
MHLLIAGPVAAESTKLAVCAARALLPRLASWGRPDASARALRRHASP